MRPLLVLLALCLACQPLAAEELSITLKPGRGLTGTLSANFHDDGAVTLLVYQSPTQINERPLALSPAVAADLKAQARAVLADYLSRQQYADLPHHPPLLGVAVTVDGVTRSLSTRRYSANAVRMVNSLNAEIDDNERVSLD